MATKDKALAEARQLKAHLERYGIVTSIELQAGRLDEWWVEKYLHMNHHTATKKPPEGGNLTPALYICKYGRSDVPGPLCNGYGGYDFVYRIITMGLANHPGAGGPITIDGVHVPKDSMRRPSFGTEWEGGYHTWTDKERIWMATVNRAITEFYERSIFSQLEHSTWAPLRKIDRLDYTRTISINDTAKIQPESGEGEWLDMVSEAEFKEAFEGVAPAGRRIAEEGVESPATVYYSDLQSYIFECKNGGRYDTLRKNLLNLMGESTAAMRLPKELLDEMMDVFPDAKQLP